MSNILLVAGGSNQVSLAEDIVSSGHKLIVVDPFHHAPCSDLADIHIQCDTRHYLDIINSLIIENIVIDGVTSDQSDAALLSVSKVAEYFDLPHTPSWTIRNCLDKYSQFLILSTNNVPVPLTSRLELQEPEYNTALIEQFFPSTTSRAVIKPSDSQGSKGVQIVDSLEDLYFKLHSTTRETCTGDVLIQEHIVGPEFSLDAVIINRILYPLALASKYHYLSNPCIDERNTFFGDLSSSLYESIITTVRGAATALDLNNTLVHAELIQNTDNNTTYLIEISPRGGGGSISSKIVPYLTGFSANNFLISKSLGSPFVPPDLCYNQTINKYVVMRFLPELNYNFQKLTISKPYSSDLLHCEMPQGPGQFKPVRDSRDRVGYFVIGSNSLDLLQQDEKYMIDSIKSA